MAPAAAEPTKPVQEVTGAPTADRTLRLQAYAPRCWARTKARYAVLSVADPFQTRVLGKAKRKQTVGKADSFSPGASFDDWEAPRGSDFSVPLRESVVHEKLTACERACEAEMLADLHNLAKQKAGKAAA